MKLAPIVLFVYNRPWHTRQTLESLKKNPLAKDSLLIVFADGPKKDASAETIKKIEEVRKILLENKWCKKIIIHKAKANKGLAKSIIDGVTEVVNKYGKIIVLEDDLELSSGFLKYMNEALEMYKDEEKVMHISGYMFPVKGKLPETFFYNTASCWGWATWRRAWAKFTYELTTMKETIDRLNLRIDFDINKKSGFYQQIIDNLDGKIETWAIRWYASIFLNNGFCLHPYPSLVNNVGHDGTGENCGQISNFSWDKLAQFVRVKKIDLVKSDEAIYEMNNFYNNLYRKISFGYIFSMISKIISFKRHIWEKASLNLISKIPRFSDVKIKISDLNITINDSASFLSNYREIFIDELYKFVSPKSQPVIIDCGANIGLSVLYFKRIYPDAVITAFEPDPKIFRILSENVKRLGVKAVGAAVWNKNGYEYFYQDGADGGKIKKSDTNKTIKVKVVDINSVINGHVDFLKIDIEGAEFQVLERCQKKLRFVDNLFVEYHQFENEKQHLGEILNLLKKSGFRYYIKQHGISPSNPFLPTSHDTNISFLLNIFAYR